MMTDELYLRMMLVASGCLVLTGLLLALVRTPNNELAAKFRGAKHALTLAVLLLGVFNIVQLSFDPEGDVRHLGSCIALAISSVQAMLFTNTVIVLISPSEVTLRRVLWQLGVILLVDTLLVGAYILLPLDTYLYVYELCVILYIALLVGYTHWYMRLRRQFLAQVSAYYEEEEIERSLRWLGILFWVALAVGVLSLLMLLANRTVDVCLTALLALCYAFFAACFVNYQLSIPLVLPALYQRVTPPTVRNLRALTALLS